MVYGCITMYMYLLHYIPIPWVTRCKQDLIGYYRECVHARLRTFDFFGGNNKNVGKVDIILHTSLIITASASPSAVIVEREQEYALQTHTHQNAETIDIKGR